MTMAEERDAISGRTPPEDPANAFNGHAQALPEQAEPPQTDINPAKLAEQFKASFERTQQALDQIKDIRGRGAQEKVQKIQDNLGMMGQLASAVAVSSKAKSGMRVVAPAVAMMQKMCMGLINNYLKGSQQAEMLEKINQTADESSRELNRLIPELENLSIDPRQIVGGDRLDKMGTDLKRVGMPLQL